MLNENIQKESEAQEKPAAQEDGAAETKASELSCSQEREKGAEEADDGKKVSLEQKAERPAKKDEPKKVVKSQKIDAVIAGALAKAEPAKDEPKVQGQKTQKPAVKKAAADSASQKIDPRQLEFMRNVAEKNSSDKDAKNFEKAAFDPELKAEDLLPQSPSLLDGENFIREPENFSYGFEGLSQENSFDDAKIASPKKADKKPVIQVTDLRTKTEPAAAQKPLEKDARKNFAVSVKEVSKGSVEMTLDLNGAQAQKNILSLDGQSAAADGSTFQAMLKNQIAQNAGDFVKAGNIVLRDGDQGQINLILHPEDLGNVKINMELNGKSLVGHITVQSKEAMEAFGQNADALRQAFIQSGFEDATFDVSFAGSQMNFAQNGSQNDADDRARQGRKIYGEFAQESLTSTAEVSDNFIGDDVSVNIVA